MSYGQLPPVPSGITGSISIYLNQIRERMNSLPHVSYFSGTSPNSTVTGLPGLSLAVNLGSASSFTRWWVMGGAAGSQLTQLGWVPLRILA